MRARALLPVVALSTLAACGSRSTWEPESEAAARYGSGTDEALLLDSMRWAVQTIVDAHPPADVKSLAIRVPRDPDGYSAAALLADSFEKGGARVSWMAFDAAAAPPSTAEVWEVATTVRGAVTLPSNGGATPFRREAVVEVRVSSVAARDARLLWNAKGRGTATCYVNVRFPERRVIPDAR